MTDRLTSGPWSVATAVAASLLLTAVCGTGAAAQSAGDQLDGAVGEAAIVTVTIDGETSPVRGILRDAGRSAITLDIAGRLRRVELATVRTIDRDGDSLLNGMLIGAAVLGTWCAAVCGQGSSLSLASVVAGNAAIGAGIGAIIDANRKGQTTIYRRPVALRASLSGAAIRLTIAF